MVSQVNYPTFPCGILLRKALSGVMRPESFQTNKKSQVCYCNITADWFNKLYNMQKLDSNAD